MCITGGDFDCRRELQVKELVVYVLSFFTLGRLLHDLQVHGFFDLGCYC